MPQLQQKIPLQHPRRNPRSIPTLYTCLSKHDTVNSVKNLGKQRLFMMHSSYCISSSDTGISALSQPFLVIGSHEKESHAAALIRASIAKGVRAIVMQKDKAGAYQQPLQAILVEGVSYFFVRSLSKTLDRWQARFLGHPII